MAGITVTWSVVSGGGAVATPTTTTNAAGQAQTQYTLGATPGANQVKAAVQGSTLETTFTATAQAPPADNTPAEIVLISGNAQSTKAGTALTDSLIVEVRNAAGTPLASVAVDWSVTGGGTLGAATVVTNASGRAANAYTAGNTAGSPTVTAAVETNPALSVAFNVTVTPDDVPATMAIVSGNNQTAAPSTALGQPLVAVVRNALAQPLENVTVAWTVTAGGGALGSATSTTNVGGQASNTYTTGAAAGANTIQAAVQSNTNIKVTFTATALPLTAGVSVQDNSFNPFNATVLAGGTVTWTWTGGNPHDVTWVSGGFTNSATQTSGAHNVTFASAGTFTYYCTIHGTPTTGMRGTVTAQ